MPQMSAQVFFVIARAEDALVVPLSALTPGHDPGTFTARVQMGERIEERIVKIGARDRLNGEVLSGLSENEALVTGIRRDRASGRLRW
jgi:macrolide-specific efflux system membrane fusion protein